MHYKVPNFNILLTNIDEKQTNKKEEELENPNINRV